jgi:hypothetical protein
MTNDKTKQPQDDKSKNTDAMFYELNRSLRSLTLMTHLVVFYFKFMRKAIKVIENIFVASWFGLILIAIWTDNAMYYKIAFSVIVGGGALAYIGKALIELFKKSKPAEKKPEMSDTTKNMMIMSILMDKWKDDTEYRKSVTDKFFNDMMAKKEEVKSEGEKEKE